MLSLGEIKIHQSARDPRDASTEVPGSIPGYMTYGTRVTAQLVSVLK